MTLREAKNQAATEWGFRDYKEMTDVTIPDDKFINRVMEIYGNAQWNAAEEIKTLDAITTKFAHELREFERTHGTINAGFATGLFRKLLTAYASQQRTTR